MTAALPPWPARSPEDNWTMFRWLNDRLDEIFGEMAGRALAAWDEGKRPEQSLDDAIELAEHGGIESLRRELVEITKDPRVSKFVNLPKLKSSTHWPRYFPDDGVLALAAVDARLIRWAWAERLKKKKRRKTDGWSAELFAALRNAPRHNDDPLHPDILALEAKIVQRMKKTKKRPR